MESSGSINISILTNLKGFLSLLLFLRAIFGVISERGRVFEVRGWGGGLNPQKNANLWEKKYAKIVNLKLNCFKIVKDIKS